MISHTSELELLWKLKNCLNENYRIVNAFRRIFEWNYSIYSFLIFGLFIWDIYKMKYSNYQGYWISLINAFDTNYILYHVLMSL